MPRERSATKACVSSCRSVSSSSAASEARQPPDGEAHAAVEGVVLAARPRRRAGRVVVALAGQQDDRDGRGRLVAEGPHERRVVPIEDPQDLAADVLVRVSVVAHVEMGEARLVERGFRALVAPEPLQERAGLGVGVLVEESGEELDGLARAVLADEGVGQAAGRLRVGSGAGQQVARRALRGRPVARLEPQAEEGLGDPRAGRRHGPGPIEQRRRGVVAAPLPVAGRGADQDALQQVPRGRGVAGVEVFRRAHVLRGERRPRPQALREAGRRLAVGIGGARRAQAGVRDLGRRRDRRRGLDRGRRRRRPVAVGGRTGHGNPRLGKARRGRCRAATQVNGGGARDEREAEGGEDEGPPGGRGSGRGAGRRARGPLAAGLREDHPAAGALRSRDRGRAAAGTVHGACRGPRGTAPLY